jgi:lysophospholipase L1-like esterase
VRLKLLRARAGKPLMDMDRLASYQTELLGHLRALGARVLVLGLLPVDQARFPSSPEQFKIVNARLREISAARGVEFFDWASLLPSNGKAGELFYRDSFHPNAAGATVLAQILREHLCHEYVGHNKAQKYEKAQKASR